MKKRSILKAVILAFISSLIAIEADALDYPHNGINNIGCDSCHYIYGTEPTLMLPWLVYGVEGIDDTQYNSLCWSCHNNIIATDMETHSSLQIDNDYGYWTVECKVCHNPHYQKQFNAYGSESYLYSGISTDIQTDQPSAGKSELTMTGAGWVVNEYQGLVVIPNISQGSYGYRIESNTDSVLTIKGQVDLTKVTPGVDTFAIIYGKLIYDTVVLDNITDPLTPKTGNKTVKFLRSTGTNSFADGDTTYNGICEVCHTETTHFRNDGTGTDQLHGNMGYPAATRCTRCHQHNNGFRGMGGGAHTTHIVNNNGPQLECADCHDTSDIPSFKSGTDVNGDGKYDLSETDVCDTCHSADGVASAKNYWTLDPGSWVAAEGEEGFCGSCHDLTPGNSSQDGTGDQAPNIAGDKSTYGFFITGHGKASGNYARLSWQNTLAAGNPAANRSCGSCHDLTTQHFNNSTRRLKPGYENDAGNSNCKQCHDPGSVAVNSPDWYTTYTDYENSAHGGATGNLKCSDCHDVHGASGANPAMTRANQENLCYQCHTEGGVQNDAISGAELADDIEEAFGKTEKHNLGTSFTIGSSDYTLECVSCHNVHLITGKYVDADIGKSPITMFSDNLTIWGDDSGEKMDAYDSTGTYRTPQSDTFTGAQLPDYASFCLDCHAQPSSGHPNFGINWEGDPHGKQSANEPDGYGTCPNWFTCGKASGWDGDDCISDQATCWPVIPRGKGDQLWVRNPYNHEERIAGANFTLSCTDCHEAHGSGVSSMLRSNPNGGTGTVIWNTMCNNCHYYYSNWHAGMSCGNASCHVTNSIHRMDKNTGSFATRSFDPDMVLYYAFENNLKDSGDWQIDGKWMDDIAGSFTTGISGQAVVLNGGNNVQVGTEDSYWSTDEGAHGTWKYTEMKYNTTLEAWVYPTDDTSNEYSIFTKHVGYNDGGYAFTLQKINGGLRAAFNVQIDNNGGAQGGASGVRGAYSSVNIPLNTWTHVAATFDTNGPDRNPDDPSVGRIRIYVNGEDVTTGDASGNYMQPDSGETSIYAYSENSPWNQGICYNGDWCASEFSIGGFYGWQNSFIGRIDEAKVWNITKDAAYFETADSQSPPRISMVEGLIGTTQLTVVFTEGVYAGTGATGALEISDFTLTDTNSDNPRTITGVTHTPGGSTATITMSQPLIAADLYADTLAAAVNSVYDEYDNLSGTDPVTITLSSVCPTGIVDIPLNDPAGSSYIMDTQDILYGMVAGTGTLTGGEYSGDGINNYIDFEYNNTCLQASAAMTLEARIKPAGFAGETGTYVKRVFARDTGGNYQMSVWRKIDATNWPNYTPPDGVASVAFWVKPVDNHGGKVWKPVLTDYNTCPIVSDHWYEVKAVWNSGKPGGTTGQFFVPADIYVDDQGTDGVGTAENWSGYINCTDSDQSQLTDERKLYTGDTITVANGDFVIGANVNNHTRNVFNGLIDWIMWQDVADYTGVDDPPY